MDVHEAKLAADLEVNSVRNTTGWIREFLLRIVGGRKIHGRWRVKLPSKGKLRVQCLDAWDGKDRMVARRTSVHELPTIGTRFQW